MILPEDVWLNVMVECGAEEILCLSQCSKSLRELARDRTVWLNALYKLEISEAPRILPHIPLSSYNSTELRSIVTNAKKEAHKAEKDKKKDVQIQTMKRDRVVRVPIADFNPDEVLGEVRLFGLELSLLPGGKLLLVTWPAGYIQLWDLSGQEKDSEPKSLWLYPDYPEGLSEDRPLLVYVCHYEMQEDGSVIFVIMNELLQDELLGTRYYDIVRVSPDTGAIDMLTSKRKSPIEWAYGPPEIVRIQGDLVVYYQELYSTNMGALTVALWREDYRFTMCEAALDAVEITEEFIICIRRDDDERKSIIVLSIKDIRDKLRAKANTTEELKGLVSIELAIPFDFPIGRRPELMLCNYHWRPKSSQDKVLITVCEDARGVSFHKGVFNARFSLLLGGEKPSLELLKSGMWMFASPDDRVKQHGGVFAILPNWSSPGSTPIVFHDKKSGSSDESEDEVQLALLSLRHEMGMEKFVFKESAELTTFRCDFYSGSIVYASKLYESVIVSLGVAEAN